MLLKKSGVGLLDKSTGLLVKPKRKLIKKIRPVVATAIIEPMPPVIIPTPEPEIDLIAVNKSLQLYTDYVATASTMYDRRKLIPINLLRGMAGTYGNIASCCGAAAMVMNTITTAINNGLTAIEFGELLYNKWQIVWNNSGKTDTSKDNILAGSNLKSAYVFISPYHQGEPGRNFLKQLGAEEIYLGYNTIYTKTAGDRSHELYMYVLTLEHSMKKFFEIHKEYFTNKYKSLVSKTA